MERIKNKKIFRSMRRFEKNCLPKSWQNPAGRREAEQGKSRVMAAGSDLRLARALFPGASEKEWGKKGGPAKFPNRARWFSI